MCMLGSTEALKMKIRSSVRSSAMQRANDDTTGTNSTDATMGSYSDNSYAAADSYTNSSYSGSYSDSYSGSYSDSYSNSYINPVSYMFNTYSYENYNGKGETYTAN